MSRICTFGAFDPHYPRNQILRHGLALQGMEVVVVNAPRRWPTWRKLPYLAKAFVSSREARGCRAVVLAEFGQSLAGLAWVLARARRVPLVVDFFTSMYETVVHDRQQASERSLKARRTYFIDKVALRLADAVLVDTQANADYAGQTFGLAPDKVTVVPVGAFDEWFHPQVEPAGSSHEGLLVQFFGTYIPLHGIETILRAAERLRGRGDLHFELLGRGQMYPQMRALADDLNLSNVTFSQPVPPPDLPGRVAAADICLGIFGATDKAQRVIPNKLYQSLAMRKPVVSGDTPALREAFEPGVHLSAVPVDDPAALAEAIRQLADDAPRREALAEAGYRRVREAFTPEALGARLGGVLAGLGVGRS
jgi:glycosyltransferase involved in cell wall biosynthesis